MLATIDVAFYAGTALYVGAALVAAGYLWSAGNQLLNVAKCLLVAGAICLVVTFLLRWTAWRLLPLTTITDSLNLFAVLTTAVMLWALRKNKTAALLCFYLPPLAAICLVNAAVAHQFLHDAPRQLRGIPLTIHVGLAFLAYALFFVASMTSVGYIFQAQHVKRHKTIGLFRRLPSLEQLDQTLWRLIYYGYPLFVITLLLGLIWAWVDRDLLSPRWWLAPKVALSCAMAIFYAVAFHARKSGWLRGPKLAYLVLVGFSSLLMTYLVLAVTNLHGYNFWEGAP